MSSNTMRTSNMGFTPYASMKEYININPHNASVLL